MEKIIAGYARLSKKEQTYGITLEQQIERLKSAGATEIFVDIESGRKDNRSNFQKLLTAAKEGKVSKIICTRLDRFSRKTVTAITNICDLNDFGVEVHLLDTPLQAIGSAAGKLMLTQLAAAQFESDMLADRVKHGLNYKKKLGLVTAGQGPFGYVVNTQDKLELDKRPFLCLLSERPSNWMVNRQYYDEIYNTPMQLYDFENDKYCNYSYILNETKLSKGRSRADIARNIVLEFLKLHTGRGALRSVHTKYGIPERTFEGFKKLYGHDRELVIITQSHITNWLRNPILRGQMAYLNQEKCKQHKGKLYYYHSTSEIWDIVPDTHPNDLVIFEDEWELIKVILEQNRLAPRTPNKTTKVHLYAGLVFCQECNRKLNSRRSGSYQHLYYHCRTIGCSNAQTGKSIREDSLNKFVLPKLHDRAIEIQSQQSSYQTKVVCKSQKLIKLEESLEKILVLLKDNPHDDILSKAKNDYLFQINEEKQSTNDSPVWDKTAQEIIRLPAMCNYGYLLSLSHGNLKLVYYKLVKRIYINNGEVTQVILNI
ncbi:recombinase family protein [Nodularia spumigena CS-586/05]|uniref:recombinase family protein n=1 Tax=Nodularia spumigena TaxID=70799 RepID=UPI0023303F7D|nr:recombinase family protein [Nodularia spumigena]MDB9342496.1 recombinase family protein [Nodularia spumigena CS-588/06]MDB9368201.1 recombinase family protein [Nodularia spumigena CS-586/05]